MDVQQVTEHDTATPLKRTHSRSRRPLPPPTPEITDVLHQLRTAVRHAMNRKTLAQAAGLAACSTNTISRVLRSESINISTAVRILSALGYGLRISIERRRAINNTPEVAVRSDS